MSGRPPCPRMKSLALSNAMRSTGKPNPSSDPAAVAGSALKSNAGAGLRISPAEALMPILDGSTLRSTASPSSINGVAGANGASLKAIAGALETGCEGWGAVVPALAGNASGPAAGGGATVAGTVTVTEPALKLVTELPTLSVALTPMLYEAPAGSVCPARARSRLHVLPLRASAGSPCTYVTPSTVSVSCTVSAASNVPLNVGWRLVVLNGATVGAAIVTSTV